MADEQPKLQRVQFTQSHNGYNRGEIAGFSDAEAAALVEKGVAHLTDRDGTEPLSGEETTPAPAEESPAE